MPENSLEAFRLAGRAGYGVELDVQLTKDGQVVVFHDDTLDRVCGVPGKLSDKSYDELKLLSLCGTNQRIPLLTEVLEVYQGRGPLLVELKTGSRNRELCEKTYAILSDYPGEVCIESFNPFIVAWFRRHAKDIVRGQLATRPKDYGDTVSKRNAFLLSHCLFNFLAQPPSSSPTASRLRPLGVRFAEAADDVHQDLHHFVHVLRGDVLIGPVEGGAAGAEVRARQAREAEPRAVRPAAHRSPHRFKARKADGLFRAVDDLHMPAQDLRHVAVLLLQGEGHGPLAVFRIQRLLDLAQAVTAGRVALRVVVADDVFELRLLTSPDMSVR